MDLYRVVTATGDITKPAAVESAKEFLNHAINDFDKFPNTEQDVKIKEDLEHLSNETYKLKDIRHRLRWAENVLTSRCRMY